MSLKDWVPPVIIDDPLPDGSIYLEDWLFLVRSEQKRNRKVKGAYKIMPSTDGMFIEQVNCKGKHLEDDIFYSNDKAHAELLVDYFTFENSHQDDADRQALVDRFNAITNWDESPAVYRFLNTHLKLGIERQGE